MALLVNQTPAVLANGGGATKNITIPAPTAGNTLILLLSGTGSEASSVTGGGVTWTKIAAVVEGATTRQVEIWAGPNSSGSGTTVSVTYPSAYHGAKDATVLEVSGMPATLTVDPSTGLTNTGQSATASTPSVTPTAGQEMFGVAVVRGDTVTNSPSGGFSALTRPGGGNAGTGWGYRAISGSSGSYGSTFANSPSYAQWAAAIALLVGTAGGDTTPPTLSGAATNTAGTQITATLSESGCVADGGGSSGTGGFTLSGTSATVASWSISGTTLTLTLSGTITNGQTVTYSYARASTTDDIKDAAGNYLADFSGASVTNNVPATLVAGTASFVNSGPAGISVSATAPTGGSGAGPTYQWERNSNGGAYGDLAGATSLSLTDTTATTAGTLYGYRCKQTRGGTTVTTNAVTAEAYQGGDIPSGGGGGVFGVFASPVIAVGGAA